MTARGVERGATGTPGRTPLSYPGGVNLFVLGLRRSGTTILYDALCEDPELACYYEPLREEAETIGGGSGAREGDAFAETRVLRERFREQRYPELPIELFNWEIGRAHV